MVSGGWWLADTHCHLDYGQFDADREAVVERARAADVRRILVPGTDLASSRRAVALAEAYPEVRAAVGVHPTNTADFDLQSLAELRELAAHPKVDAIGEIGIDLYWKIVPLITQQQALADQLELAESLGKPVIIHDREAHAEVMAALKDAAPAAGVVLHSFSGEAEMAQAAIEAGYYLGVDGPLTYKKNEALRAIFAAVPLERILIETDSPYLTPQAWRGQRNEPAYVRAVADKLAEITGRPLEEVAAATSANAARLFGWEW
jgi:TatD DNase family protein